jgi:hypothetical protein
VQVDLGHGRSGWEGVALKGKWMSKMRQVVIDNKKGIVEVEGKQVPRLLLGIIKGAVGKHFVVKHYRGKKKRRLVVTRYPNMSGIVASEQQRVRRDLFREAVVYAKWIISDDERKKVFRKTLPRKRRKHVYQAAIRLYMSMQGDARWLRKQLAVKAITREYTEDILVKSPNVVWWQFREDRVRFFESANIANIANFANSSNLANSTIKQFW